MHRSSRLASLFASLLAIPFFACSGSVDDSAAAGGAGGSGAAGGAGGSGGACAEPDLVCPAKPPFPGSPCEVTDACKYPVGDGMNTWTYSCTSGHWAGEATCEGAIGGGCPTPPLAETCDKPFGGSATKASIELGVADPTQGFAPIAEGSELPVIWGGQGSPMVAYRVRVSGVDASCIRIDTTLSAGGKSGAPTPNAIALHCGESLSVYNIFPIELVSCEPPMESYVDLELQVAVEGVGTVKKTVKVANPGCALPG